MSELQVNVSFLQLNSEVHEWVFGALAELLDNSLDAKSSIIKIYCEELSQKMLVVQDDGHGMDDSTLRAAMALGQSSKQASADQIGRFGVGFKSGSMRIADDVLVFTKTETTKSVGLLSQTWLIQTHQNTIKYHVITWHNQDPPKLITKPKEYKEALEAMTNFSPFKNSQELLDELAQIENTGTRVLLYNLKKSAKGLQELEFTKDDVLITQSRRVPRKGEINLDIKIDYSLRSYCEMLYYVPKSSIFLMQGKVKTKMMRSYLQKKKIYAREGLRTTVILGYSAEAKKKGLCGMMIYYRNRLVLSYHRVGIQLLRNYRGEGIIGIQVADFLVPKHNKQEFQNDELFAANDRFLALALKGYWDTFYEDDTHKVMKDLDADWEKGTEDKWIMCDKCIKWRKVPRDYEYNNELWFCHMNPIEEYNNCSVAQEPYGDEDEVVIDVKDTKEVTIVPKTPAKESKSSSSNKEKASSKTKVGPSSSQTSKTAASKPQSAAKPQPTVKPKPQTPPTPKAQPPPPKPAPQATTPTPQPPSTSPTVQKRPNPIPPKPTSPPAVPPTPSSPLEHSPNKRPNPSTVEDFRPVKMSRTEIWDGQLQTFDKKNNIMVAVCTLQSMDAPVSLPSALYVKKYHTHQSISPNIYAQPSFTLECAPSSLNNKPETHRYKEFLNFIGKDKFYPEISIGSQDIVLLPPSLPVTESTKINGVLLTAAERELFITPRR